MKNVKVNYQLNKTSDSKGVVMAWINYGYTIEEDRASYSKRMLKLTATKYPDLKMELVGGLLSDESIQEAKAEGGEYAPKVKYMPAILATPVKVAQPFWNPDRTKNKNGNAVYVKKGQSGYIEKNKWLNEFPNHVQKLFNFLIEQNPFLTPDELKRNVQTHILNNNNGNLNFYFDENKVVSSCPTIFTKYIDFKIDKWKRQGAKSSSTYSSYKTLKTWIEKYELEKKMKFDLLTLMDNHLEEFIEWMLRQKKEDGSIYKINYYATLKTGLKHFINQAKDQDTIPVKVNLRKEFLMPEIEDTDAIYLRIDEVQKMKDYIPENETEKKVKNMFLIGCAVGCRFSDLKGIEHIYFDTDNKNWFFEYKAIKTRRTNEKVKVPVFDNFIVDLYHERKIFDNKMKEHLFNDEIKKLCRKLKFSRTHKPATIHPLNKELIYKDEANIAEYVSSGTCRKTFASLCIRHYKKQIPLVMSWTSHKTEKAFKRYVKLTQEDFYKMAVE